MKSEEEQPVTGIQNLWITGDDGTLVWYNRKDHEMNFLDLTSGSITDTVALDTSAAAVVSPDGQQIAWVENEEQAVYVMDVASGAVISTALPPSDLRIIPGGMIRTLHFTPDGTCLVFTGYLGDSANSYANQILIIPLAE